MNTFILQDWRLFVNVLSYFSCPPALLPPGDLSQAPKREAGAPGGRRRGRAAPPKGGAGAFGPCALWFGGPEGRQTPPPPRGARLPPGKAAGRPPCSRKKPLSTQETAAGKTEGGDPAFYPAWPWGDDRYQIRNAGATRCTQVPARGIVAKYSPTCCPAGYPRGNRCRR